MQRAQERRSGGADAAARAEAAAAAELVAPLRQLMYAAMDALHRLRPARGLELFERALAAAEALPLPQDSLVVAFCVSRLVRARTTLSSDAMAAAAEPSQFKEALEVVWRGDARALLLAQRCLALYHARWRAGTLFTLTPQELAFFLGHTSPVQTCAEEYISVAADAVSDWPPLRTPADEEARTLGVHGALRVALEMAARDALHLSLDLVAALRKTMSRLHNDSAAGGGMLDRLRATCGLSNADVTALSALAKRDDSLEGAGPKDILAAFGEYRARAATDVARYGLRHCALPSCSATEPEPKFYKLCGRCRGAAYCSAAHSKEDWKRHKREEGCQATPGGS
jgi:hypothetical protein